jgi:hypothetical protein
MGVAAAVTLIVAAVILLAFKFEANSSSWKSISWRAHLFALKAEGDVPEFSWRELWFMVHARGGFGLEGFVDQGFSIEGTVIDGSSTPNDLQVGEQIFRARR